VLSAQRDEDIPLDRVDQEPARHGQPEDRQYRHQHRLRTAGGAGREIYGSLVPYGRIWHPGANDATSMTVSRDIEVNGKALPKGSYSLWTIPAGGRWTFIFNTSPTRSTPATPASSATRCGSKSNPRPARTWKH
jgi:hypothetical protein